MRSKKNIAKYIETEEDKLLDLYDRLATKWARETEAAQKMKTRPES